MQPFLLASFTQLNVVKVCPRCNIYNHSIWGGWIIFHCIDISHFNYLSIQQLVDVWVASIWGVIVNNAVWRSARGESYGSSQVISEHVPSLNDMCGLLDSQEHVGSFQSPYFQKHITLSPFCPIFLVNAVFAPAVTPCPRWQLLTGACMCAESLSCAWLFVTPWTEACQSPLSMEFFRQQYWVGCHFHLQEIFLTQGLNTSLLCLLNW